MTNLSITIDFPGPENLEAFMLHPELVAGEYHGVCFKFNTGENWKNQLIMEFDGNIPIIILGIHDIAGQFTASAITTGSLEGDAAGYEASSEFDSEESEYAIRQPKKMQASARRRAPQYIQEKIPAANHSAAYSLKSCFQTAMDETTASMEIEEVNDATFKITYRRGNHEPTDSDIENCIKGLMSVKVINSEDQSKSRVL